MPWRELTAQAFDSEHRQEALTRVHRLELEYTASPNTSQPLLFAGWLASRLGWQFQERTAQGYLFNGGSGTVEVICTPIAGDDPGTLHLIRLDLTENSYLLIRSGLIADCVQLHLEEDGVCTYEKVSALRALSLAELLAQEIQTSSTTDPFYHEALTVVQAL
jgi:glucose-6-phosphate dehydrogenase assembly protein OpcA